MTDFPAVVYLKAQCKSIEESAIASTAEESAEVNESEMKESHPKKRMKVNKTAVACEENHDSLKKLLGELNKEITKKLDAVDERLDLLAGNCEVLEEKVENLSAVINRQRTSLRTTVSPVSIYSGENAAPAIPISSRVTFITLNTEDDYPNGSWLGDENNTECRVRCHISPTDLFHISTTCTTAEKMALTLLDYLFDRETQACSNISGMGKHKKKQLDPLYIYGIKCHLKLHFGTTDQDWNKIKQNIDSKCRTAFRRKIRGLSLVPKGQQNNSDTSKQECANFSDFTDPVSTDSILSHASEDKQLQDELSFQRNDSVNEQNILERVIKEAKIIHSNEGDFHILHATAEQVAELQQTHQIQLLSGGEILATPMKLSSNQDINSEHS